MSRRMFRGGVHPPERKLSADMAIEVLPAPDEIVLPLSMHIGAPAKPVVQGGDEVKLGQLVAEAGGFVSAPIHSPVSGKVRRIEDRDHPLGRKLPCIIIDNDHRDDAVEFTPPADWRALDPQAIIDAVHDAGIVGMGGATFPTHVKLSPPPKMVIDTVIANGVECEPYLTSDHRMMLERPEKILTGLQIVMHVFGIEKGFIGIEINKPDAIELIKKKAVDYPGVKVLALPVRYPQGAEKQLIYAATRREIPSGALPMAVNCLVQNVSTLAAIRDALVEGKPLIERVATVTGEAIKQPKNLQIRFGTPLWSLIDAAGGYREPAAKLINGGPMMGLAQYTPATPAIKGTSGVLALPERLVEIVEAGPCLRCGMCVRGCPMGLLPAELAKAVQNGLLAEAEALGALDCIECGSCGYGCPAHIKLMHWIRLGKAQVMAKRRKS